MISGFCIWRIYHQLPTMKASEHLGIADHSFLLHHCGFRRRSFNTGGHAFSHTCRMSACAMLLVACLKKRTESPKRRQISFSNAIQLYGKIHLSARWHGTVRGLRAKGNDSDESACRKKGE